MELNYKLDTLLILIALLGFVVYEAADFFNISNGAIFFYKTSIGQCYLDQESCDLYPVISKYAFVPFALFGEQTFYLLTKILVFLVPAMIFYKLYNNHLIALLYVLSPVSLNLAFGGYLAQLLAFVLFILAVKYRRELGLVAFPIALMIHRYAIYLIGLFAVAFIAPFTQKFIDQMRFVLIAMLIISITLLVDIKIPIYSIFQTSWLSIVAYSLPITVMFAMKTQSSQALLLVLLCATMITTLISVWHFDKYFIDSHFTDFNFSRFWETYDFVLLVGFACKQ